MHRPREALETLRFIVCDVLTIKGKLYYNKRVRSTADTVYIAHILWLILSSGQLICTAKTVILLRYIINTRHKCIVLRYFMLFAIQLERITKHLKIKN